jgi:hypothetical protein
VCVNLSMEVLWRGAWLALPQLAQANTPPCFGRFLN